MPVRRATALAVCLLCAWTEAAAQREASDLYVAVTRLDDCLLAKEPVRVGQKVTLVYTHSVEKVPVLEVYEVRGAGPLYLSELISRDALLSYPGYERYRIQPWDGQSEGPLPTDLERSTRDWFEVKGLEAAKVMPQAVGSPAVNHRLLVGRKVISLGGLAEPGAIVNLTIQEARSLPAPCPR